jgi:hypothetical protein
MKFIPIITMMLSSLSLAPCAFAEPESLINAADATEGHVTIVGKGDASAAPEFARVAITVTSICYDTSRAAKDANAIVANRILTALAAFTPSMREPVTTTGGANVRRTEVIYVGSTPQTICELKWRATNTINAKSSHDRSSPRNSRRRSSGRRRDRNSRQYRRPNLRRTVAALFRPHPPDTRLTQNTSARQGLR